ncbi:hypothetical protein ACRAWF_38105 [Streptomyces sp. L7]
MQVDFGEWCTDAEGIDCHSDGEFASLGQQPGEAGMLPNPIGRHQIRSPASKEPLNSGG